MTGQCGDLSDGPVFPVIKGVPEIDLVEAVPVGCDHLVGDTGEGEVADLGT